MRTLRVSSSSELRQVDHRAVIAWERFMRETEGAQASTIRRRLAALSSLFKHLVAHNHAARNPVADVERPTINRDEGKRRAGSSLVPRAEACGRSCTSRRFTGRSIKNTRSSSKVESQRSSLSHPSSELPTAERTRSRCTRGAPLHGHARLRGRRSTPLISTYRCTT